MRRVAIVGSGISGLAAAHALRHDARVTVYEADHRFGGHAHTVDVTIDGVTHGVDTGFLVFNHRTYPQLVRLFAELGVDTAPSDMSFSVQDARSGLEWSGCNLDTVFAQRRNLLSPRFLHMLADIVRFNRMATRLATELDAQAETAALREPLGDFLDRHRFGKAFREGYLLPMIGSIWSCPTDQMLRFPVATMVRFCHNHGLIQIVDRPQWHTVRGGSRQYVQKIVAGLPDCRTGTPVQAVRRLPPGQGTAGVIVTTAQGNERYDDVVLACHSDQALALLPEATPAERAVLGAVRYHPNVAVLHTDTAVLPKARKAWAAWNYERSADAQRERTAVCLHYLINQLQPLPWSTPVVVSLNPSRAIEPSRVIGQYSYSHPVFDAAAIAAQQRLHEIQGRSHLWFAGAWTRYGFHEDGLMSALSVAEGLRAQWQAQGAVGASARWAA